MMYHKKYKYYYDTRKTNSEKIRYENGRDNNISYYTYLLVHLGLAVHNGATFSKYS